MQNTYLLQVFIVCNIFTIGVLRLKDNTNAMMMVSHKSYTYGYHSKCVGLKHKPVSTVSKEIEFKVERSCNSQCRQTAFAAIFKDS